VDDHQLFADVIKTVLVDQGMEVVGSARTGAEGLAAARETQPDIVLVDLGLPDCAGVDVGRKILEERPETKVLAVTASADPRSVRDTMRAGFHGYVTKDTSLAQFVSSVRAAVEGQVVLPHRLASAAAGSVSADQRHALLLAEQLSPREREVLALLVDGATSATIARNLSLSPNTVRTHVQSILTKLQAHSRLEAATFAVKYGIVRVPGQERRA
jgi:two-component system nitrate/nitrite response regulator NarL